MFHFNIFALHLLHTINCTVWILERMWRRCPCGWDPAPAPSVLWDFSYPGCWGGCKQHGLAPGRSHPSGLFDLLKPVRENRELKHFPYYFLKSKYPRYAGNSELSSLQMRRENKREHVCFDHMKRSLIWRRLSSSSETVLQCIVLNEEGTAHFFVEISCCSINPAILLWGNDASAGYFQCASTC